MRDVFDTYAQDYFDLGFDVIPLKSKVPITSSWVTRHHEGVSYPNCNIGLKTGKYSGVICIDIDTEDPELIKKITALLPPVYCGKRGSKKRTHNYFFKYNGEKNEKIPGVIEILSTGNQTVLPPSWHPDGHPYEWVNKHITEIDLDHLPDMPKELMAECRKLSGKETFNANEGRHNTLVRFCGGKVSDGIDPTTAINELVEYDKLNHDPPYFTDETEPHKGSGFFAAMKMYTSVAETAKRSGEFVEPVTSQSFEIIDQPIIEVKEKERARFPKLRGIAQEMFEYIYASSPVPRSRFAMASALSSISIVLANKIRLRGTYPNVYSLIVAPSGYGKDFPLKFPKKLLRESGHKALIGHDQVVSDAGLLNPLEHQRERIDVIDEATQLFSTMNDTKTSFTARIADVYTQLFTSCGEIYEGRYLASQDKTRGACSWPYLCLFAATTPKGFKGTVSETFIEKGLGARFLYFFDDQYKASVLPRERHYGPIPERVLSFVKHWREVSNLAKDEIVENGGLSVKEISYTDGAADTMDEFHNFIEQKKKVTAIDDKMLPIYNRAYQIFEKLCIIDTVSMDYTSDGFSWPKIKKDNADWATRWMTAYFKIMEDFINDHVSDEDETRISKIIDSLISKIKNSSDGMTKNEITRFLRKKGIIGGNVNQVMLSCVNGEDIVVSKEKTKGRPKETYFHSSRVKINKSN